MPESVCLRLILGNALGRSSPPSSNSSWYICFTGPSRSRRKPSADKRKRRPETSFPLAEAADALRHSLEDDPLSLRFDATPFIQAISINHLFGWISRWLRSIWCTSAELSRSG